MNETSPADFGSIADVDLGEADGPFAAAGKCIATGIVLFETDGRLWLFEPLNHFGGYQHTFPKGRPEPGLTRRQNAHKELFEETGLFCRITGMLGDFPGDTTVTRYYLGIRSGGEPTCGPETEAVKLVSLHEARKLLNKPRDQDVLSRSEAELQDLPLPQSVIDALAQD